MSTSSSHIAFVAGATGYTGREVVRALVGHGVKTFAHVRPDSRRLEEYRSMFASLGAETDSTPWDKEALTTRLAELRPSVVYALLGTTRAKGGDYEGVDYGLSVCLLRACQTLDVPPRFVYLSSAGASPGARGAYLQARVRVERELTSSGLPYVIARPSFITGADREENRPGERIAATSIDALLSFGALLGAGKLQQRYRSTDAVTLGATLARLGVSPHCENRIYESDELR